MKVRAGLDDALLKELQSELQTAESFAGYEGSLLCFIEPAILKGYTINLYSRKFPEQSGLYFAESVEGSFGKGGGRQKIVLKYFGNADT